MGHVAYNWSLNIKELIGNKIGFKYNDDVNGFVDDTNKILYVFDGQHLVKEMIEERPGYRTTNHKWNVNGKYASLSTKLKQPWANYNGYTIVSIEVYTNHDCDFFSVTDLCGEDIIKNGWLTSSDDAWFAEYTGRRYDDGYKFDYNYNHKKVAPKHISIDFDVDELEKEAGGM